MEIDIFHGGTRYNLLLGNLTLEFWEPNGFNPYNLLDVQALH